MWGHFRRKEPDIGALQKTLGRFRRSTRVTRREDVVGVPGNAVRLGFIVLLTLLLTILLIWLRRRRRTREEEAVLTSPPPEEGDARRISLGRRRYCQGRTSARGGTP
jgi:hypothetical protein